VPDNGQIRRLAPLDPQVVWILLHDLVQPVWIGLGGGNACEPKRTPIFQLPRCRQQAGRVRLDRECARSGRRDKARASHGMDPDLLQFDAAQSVQIGVIRRFGGLDGDLFTCENSRGKRIRLNRHRSGFIFNPEQLARLIDIGDYADEVYC
jgi:hypothetical protein